jgi:hypothetical protein
MTEDEVMSKSTEVAIEIQEKYLEGQDTDFVILTACKVLGLVSNRLKTRKDKNMLEFLNECVDGALKLSIDV